MNRKSDYYKTAAQSDNGSDAPPLLIIIYAGNIPAKKISIYCIVLA